ncbi:MAG TPA: hypothetical protein VMC61_02985, partial [Methanocella sp.]|nr:hypothetical protein [Methanocella sp.]
QALSIAENDAGVAKWKAGVSNVLITGIAADSCEQGLSRIWRVTYSASGGKEATVEVLDGSVKNINTTVTQIPGPGAGLTVQGLLDSDAASRIAVEEMGKADNAPSGPGSFEVWPGTQGAPVWQITYPIEGGYYIFRIDARLGNMIGGALFHTG